MINNYFCRVISPLSDAYRYTEMLLDIESILSKHGNEIVFTNEENPLFKRVYTRFDIATDETGGRYWYKHTSIEYPNGEEVAINSPEFGARNLACLYEYIKAEIGHPTKTDDLWLLESIIHEYGIKLTPLLFDVRRIIHTLVYREYTDSTIHFAEDEGGIYNFKSVGRSVGICSANFRSEDGCYYDDYSDFDDVVYTMGDNGERISIYDDEKSDYATLIGLLKCLIPHFCAYSNIEGEISTTSTDDLSKNVGSPFGWIMNYVYNAPYHQVVFTHNNIEDGIVKVVFIGEDTDKENDNRYVVQYADGLIVSLNALYKTDSDLSRKLTNAIISQEVDNEEREIAHSATDILCDLEEKYNLDLNSIQFEVVDAIQKVFEKYNLSVIPLKHQEHYELKKNKEGEIELHSGKNGIIERVTFDNKRLDSSVMLDVLKLVAEHINRLEKEEDIWSEKEEKESDDKNC